MPKYIKMLGIFAIAIVLLGGIPKGAAEPKGTVTYIVEKGDTLDGISKKITPEHLDYRDTVYYILKENETDGTIYPGQELEVPIWEEKKW